jgi:hypothetical protein
MNLSCSVMYRVALSHSSWEVSSCGARQVRKKARTRTAFSHFDTHRVFALCNVVCVSFLLLDHQLCSHVHNCGALAAPKVSGEVDQCTYRPLCVFNLKHDLGPILDEGMDSLELGDAAINLR